MFDNVGDISKNSRDGEKVLMTTRTILIAETTVNAQQLQQQQQQRDYS